MGAAWALANQETEKPASPTGGIELPEAPPAEDADGLMARRRRRRSERMNASGVDTGSTADTVRMYLREIGRVDLLTPDDERRLAGRASHLCGSGD